MEWDVIFAPVQTQVEGVITDLLPLGIALFVLMAGIGIAFWLFRKVGVRR